MEKMKRAGFFVGALIVIGLVNASASGETLVWKKLSFFPVHGLDATVKWGSQDASCFEYNAYTIIEKQTADESDIFVRAPVKCVDLKQDDLSSGGIFQFKGNHSYFLGMHADLLLVDQSSVPGSRGLKIFNVSSKKQVYEGSYSQPMVLDGGKIKFWVKSNVEATKDNCQDYGLKPSMVIETLSALDLSNFKLDKSNKTRCEPKS